MIVFDVFDQNSTLPLVQRTLRPGDVLKLKDLMNHLWMSPRNCTARRKAGPKTHERTRTKTPGPSCQGVLAIEIHIIRV